MGVERNSRAHEVPVAPNGSLGAMALRSPLCSTLLRFIYFEEVGVAERGEDLLVIIEEFIENAVAAPHVEQHDHILVWTTAFARHRQLVISVS